MCTRKQIVCELVVNQNGTLISCPHPYETLQLNSAMTHRLFEGKEHAISYCKYRIAPPDQLIRKVLDFLEKRVRRGVTVRMAVNCRYSELPMLTSTSFSAWSTLPAGRRRGLWLWPGDGAAGPALCLCGWDGRQSGPAGYG